MHPHGPFTCIQTAIRTHFNTNFGHQYLRREGRDSALLDATGALLDATGALLDAAGAIALLDAAGAILFTAGSILATPSSASCVARPLLGFSLTILAFVIVKYEFGVRGGERTITRIGQR